MADDGKKNDKELSGGFWLVFIAVVILFFLNRCGHDYPWNSQEDSPSENYGWQTPNQDPEKTSYPAGSFGEFWANEKAAEQGQPVKPSSGIQPDREWQDRPTGTKDLEEEVKRLRKENAQLKQQQK